MHVIEVNIQRNLSGQEKESAPLQHNVDTMVVGGFRALFYKANMYLDSIARFNRWNSNTSSQL